MKSKVYFSDLHVELDHSLLDKLSALVTAAGIDMINFKDKFTAIKIHFGEPGNLSYLRPNYARVIVDMIKQRGGKPFLTDCNTLYVGGRNEGLSHLDTAYVNGFNPFATGCHVVIADGIKGTDEALIEVPHGEVCRYAHIGRAVMDADIVISLTHFKGHEAAGFGGTLKNLGMGCGSRAGKKDMHSEQSPVADKNICTACGLCRKNCAHGAISLESGYAHVDHAVCMGCGRCVGVCPTGAMQYDSRNAEEMLCKKIAEYSAAVLGGRPNFHISLVIDVSPYCDCHCYNDIPIVPDIGMLASFDPVALDQACVDLVNKAPVVPGSIIGDHPHGDRFTVLHPNTKWETCLEHAQKLGLGSRDYELITV